MGSGASLDDLIRYLLEEIALCGEQGARLSDILEYISHYYADQAKTIVEEVHLDDDDPLQSPAAPNIDRLFQEQVWTWLTSHPEIRVGRESQGNNLTLSEVEACYESHSTPAAQESIPSTNPIETQTRNDHGIRDSTIPTSLGQPRAKSQRPEAFEPESQSPKSPLRIYTTQDRMWYAVAGHGPDETRVPHMDFILLGLIAAHRGKGILQPDLIRLSGQDKRSVPGRTSRLHDRGYIEKRTVSVRSAKTSLCVLKQFVVHGPIIGQKPMPKEDIASDGQIVPKPKSSKVTTEDMIEQQALVKGIFDVLNDINLITWDDLKRKLGVWRLAWQSKVLAVSIRRLEALGSVKRVRASSKYKKSKDGYHRCVKLLHEPSQYEWQEFFEPAPNSMKQETGLNEEDADAEGDIDQSEALDPDLHDPELEEIEGIASQWIEDKPFSNFVFDFIQSSGVEGISTMDIKTHGFGGFYERPAEHQLAKFVELWQLAQPPHLRHLAIVRDTAVSDKIAHFIHYTYKNFKKLAESGQRDWEAVETVKGVKHANESSINADTKANLDVHGFPKLQQSRFQGKDNDATLLESVRASDGEGFLIPARHPVLEELQDGSFDIVYAGGHGILVGRKTHRGSGKTKNKAGRPRKNPKAVDPRIQEAETPKNTPTGWLKPLNVHSAFYFPSIAAHTHPVLAKPKGLAFKRHPNNNQRTATSLPQADININATFLSPRSVNTQNRKQGLTHGKTLNKHLLSPPKIKHLRDHAYGSPFIEHSLVANTLSDGKQRQPIAYLPSILAHTIPLSCLATSPEQSLKITAARKGNRANGGLQGDVQKVILKHPAPLPSKGRSYMTYEEQSTLITRSMNGFYIGGLTHSKSKRGRPPKSRLAVFRLPRLKEFSWFSEESQRSIEEPDDSERIVRGSRSNQRDEIATVHIADPRITTSLSNVGAGERQVASGSVSEPTASVISANKLTLASTSHVSPYSTVAGRKRKRALLESTSQSGPITNSPRAETSVAVEQHTTLGPQVAGQEHDKPSGSPNESPQIIQNENGKHSGTRTESAVDECRSESQFPKNIECQALGRAGHLRDSATSPRPTPSMASQQSETKSSSDLFDHDLRTPTRFPSNDVSRTSKESAPERFPQTPNRAPSNQTNSTDIYEMRTTVTQANDIESLEATSPTAQSEATHRQPSDMPKDTSEEQAPEIYIDDAVEISPGKHKASEIARVIPTGGSIGVLRRKIIMDILEKCGGVFPGDKELWYPFATAWAKQGNNTKPDQRTVRLAQKTLVDSGKLRQLKFSHRNKQGVVTTRTMITLGHIPPDDPRVRELQQRLIEHTSRGPYIPDGVDVTESIRKTYQNPHGKGLQSTAKKLEIDRDQVELQYPTRKYKNAGHIKLRTPAEKKMAGVKEAGARPGVQRLARLKRNLPSSRGNGYDPLTIDENVNYLQSSLTSYEPLEPDIIGRASLRSRPRVDYRAMHQGMTPEEDGCNIVWDEGTGWSGVSDLGAPLHSIRFTKGLGMNSNFDRSPSPEPEPEPLDPATLPPWLTNDFGDRSQPAKKLNSASPYRLSPPPSMVFPNFGALREKIAGHDGLDLSRSELASFNDSNGRRKPFAFTDPEHEFHPATRTYSTSSSPIELVASRQSPPSTFLFLAPIDRLYADIDAVKKSELQDLSSQFQVSGWPFINHLFPHEHETAMTAVFSETIKPQYKLGFPTSKHGVRFRNYDTKDGDAQFNKTTRAKRRAPVSYQPKARRLASLAQRPTPSNFLSAESSTVVDTDGRVFKRLRTRGRRTTNDFSVKDEKRLLAAVIAVRTLTGGIERLIDWPLVASVFEPDYSETYIHKRYPVLRQRYGIDYVASLEQKFQDSFAEAYENDQIPPLDFDRIEDYDWNWLVDWAVEKLELPFGQMRSALPNTRSQLDAKYTLREGPKPKIDEYYEISSGFTIPKRFDIIHRHPFVLPLPPKKTDDPPPSAVDIAKTWIRANVTAPEPTYNSSFARDKFSALDETAITTALHSLTDARIIIQENKGRLAPGRNYDISESFLSRMRKNIDMVTLRRATSYKSTTLDPAFRDDRAVEFSYNAGNGDVLAVLNLAAHRRVTLTPRDPPMNKWGLTEGTYKTRFMDKKKLLFHVDVRPTETYVYGEPLAPLPPPPPLRGYDATSDEDNNDSTPRRIPVWYDIMGGFVPVMWDMALAAVAGLLAVRPGAGVREVGGCLDVLGGWEIREVMEWLVRGGAARWVGGGRARERGVMLEEWWWTCAGGEEGAATTKGKEKEGRKVG